LAEDVPAGSNILCMLPDTGERYLSTALFDDVNIKMNEAEQAIANSTPTARFGHMPQTVVQLPALDLLSQQARNYVDASIANHPVMLFSLEWCDFCIEIKKMMDDLDISYRCIDVDAMEHKVDGFGDDVKKVVAAKAQCIDLPKLYIGGDLMGGLENFIKTYESGLLSDMLQKHEINWNGARLDVNNYVPKWVNKA
jgi:cysteine synthase A